MKSVADRARVAAEQHASDPGKSRKIVLTTFGSQGDLNPLIAIALRLKAEGFAPVVATSENFRQKVQREGLDFWPVRPSVEDMLRDTGMTAAELARCLMTRGLEYLTETTINPYLDQTFADLSEIIAGAELVIAGSFSFVGRIAAEKHQVPFVSILLSPMLFYSVDDPPYFIEIQWLPRVKAILGRTAVKLAMKAIHARLHEQLRRVDELRAKLGLPRSNRVPLLDGPLRGALIAGLYSPLFAKLPADAPRQSFIAGFTFFDRREDGSIALSPDLQNFLDRGAPPIIFTLGTMIAHDPAEFHEASVKAARLLGRRCVLLVAPELETEIADRLASNDVCVAGYVPYSLVFPRAAAIVHHGGIGTIAQAMRAGKPQLTCPMIGDQVDNAERLLRLGIGKRLDLKRYDATRAARALEELVVENGRPSLIASRLAPLVANEDGVAALIEKINTLLPGRPGSPAEPRHHDRSP
jgi:rhamnosyltransferase subunit B